MHLLMDIKAEPERLSSVRTIGDLLLDLSRTLQLDIRDLDVKEFPASEAAGPGVTGYAMLSESHMNIDTWPEKALVQLCLHSCKAFSVDKVKQVLRANFGPFEIRYEACLNR